ncbi:nicotinamidase-related amidase [Planomicrobium soli]|uniref:Nicotinamidase-related amidase n=1 Tax=Planomicrobium soli TaxID=1176648 RepID=A0A2P8H1U4_9BACL|nr:cysteine hydrolase family protein [Planomicrobium soli]PSL40170.1 nicotinamidase-related amidase [Planomicrobium soli]
MNQERAALLVVDVQKAFEDKKWGLRNNPQAEKNIEELLAVWREHGKRFIHIQHLSNNPDSLFHPSNRGFAIKEEAKPIEGEAVITKRVNSAFIDTDLENRLTKDNIKTIVIVGLTTPHCISTTTRMSGNLGFSTYLVSDATAAFGMNDEKGRYYDPETIHAVSLATLHEEFAEVLTTKELVTKLQSL